MVNISNNVNILTDMWHRCSICFHSKCETEDTYTQYNIMYTVCCFTYIHVYDTVVSLKDA
jgi:hypothetical protein